MYNKSLFINNDETDVLCVMKAAENVGVDKDV